MIYTSKCNNLNILRYDVLFILRLINMMYYNHIHNTALSWTPCDQSTNASLYRHMRVKVTTAFAIFLQD